MSRSLWQRPGWVVACFRVGSAEYGSGCMRSFKEVAIIFIISTIVWSQADNWEGTQPYLSVENWIKFYLARPHSSEQKPVSPTVSLSHQEASISLLSLSTRGQAEWKPHYQKSIKLVTWTTALSNSVKLWATPWRATQDGWVMVESSNKTWSTGEGNGKPFQYSCLEDPMNSMKSQKTVFNVNFI